jgi:hypothetical protein
MVYPSVVRFEARFLVEAAAWLESLHGPLSGWGVVRRATPRKRVARPFRSLEFWED